MMTPPGRRTLVGLGMAGVVGSVGVGAWAALGIPTPGVGRPAPAFHTVSTQGSVHFIGHGPAILYFYEADT